MMHEGACLCGAVTFAAEGPLRDVLVCHCTQCRRSSGHCWAATSVPLERLHVTRDDGLAWYQSSPSACRGFCRTCGASLFWAPLDAPRMAFAAGALSGSTGLVVAAHCFGGDAADYYSPEGPPPAASAAPATLQGTCLCGACRFTLPGPAGEITACHCTQCRKLSGHYAASFDAEETMVQWIARDTLAEYVTPGGGRRGFCARCGSSLWFRAADGAFSIEAGAIEGPTGGTLSGHIFVADGGDYYTIDDGLPQSPGG